MKVEGIVGVILAGGRSRRMGGSGKYALELGGERLVDRAAKRLAPQVGTIVVASNCDIGGGLDWCVDEFEGRLGPLAGLQAGFAWAVENAPDFEAIASVPVDCPFLPEDLVARLAAAGPPAFASDSAWRHQIIGLWPRDLAEPLAARLGEARELKVEAFAEAAGAKAVSFQDAKAFFNINQPADLEEAARMLDLTV